MRALMVGIALLLAVPGTAAGQRENETLVAESGSSQMFAERSRDGSVCMTIEHDRGGGGTCAVGTVSAREAASAPLPGVTGGAVAPEVERVEVEWPDGVRTSAQPVAHATFPGMRFFLTAHGTRAAFLIRYLGADGALLEIEQADDGPVVAGPVTLAAGKRWSVRGWLTRQLAPAPGAPERTEVVACMERLMRDGSRMSQCADGEPALVAPIDGGVFGTASRHFRPRPHRFVLAAVLGPSATGVDVHLGDGGRARAQVRELTAEGVTGRFATYVAPSADAIQRAVVRDAAGAELDQQVVTLPPGALGHRGHASLFSSRPALPGTPVVAAGPAKDGEGILTVREVGVRLCAEVERAEPDEVPCGLLPRRVDQSLLVAGASAHHGVVGGVVPPEVASVELKEMGGFMEPGRATVRVTPQAPAPYSGAFAPHVRTFVGVLPVGGHVRVRLFDAAGKELLETTLLAAYVVDTTERPRPARTRLRVGGVRLRSHPADTDCVFLTDTVADLLHQTCSFGGSEEVDVHVACRPAASVVIVPLSEKVRRPVLRTARGRSLKPRRLRLGDGYHAVFVVRAPDAPRALAWRGGSLAFGRVPSPREQCGYKIDLELPLGGPGR